LLDQRRTAALEMGQMMPNQSLQPTASRRTTSFQVIKTFHAVATRALARRG
jgi:hypothetical protein